MATENEYIDTLSEKELEELTSPDDNLEQADVDESAHNINIAALLCSITAAILLIGAGLWLFFFIRNKREERTFTRDLKDLKGNMQRIAKQATPMQIAHNKEVRKAMNTISEQVRDLSDGVQDTAAHMRDAFIR